MDVFEPICNVKKNCGNLYGIMVRETRHLWVGNLPENIREERILEHFKRYGRVQSVKLLVKKEEDQNGVCATVAFIDIKSASKAHGADNKIDDWTLKTDYYEPQTPSTASSAIHIHERDDNPLLRANSSGVTSSSSAPSGTLSGGGGGGGGGGGSVGSGGVGGGVGGGGSGNVVVGGYNNSQSRNARYSHG